MAPQSKNDGRWYRSARPLSNFFGRKRPHLILRQKRLALSRRPRATALALDFGNSNETYQVLRGSNDTTLCSMSADPIFSIASTQAANAVDLFESRHATISLARGKAHYDDHRGYPSIVP